MRKRKREKNVYWRDLLGPTLNTLGVPILNCIRFLGPRIINLISYVQLWKKNIDIYIFNMQMFTVLQDDPRMSLLDLVQIKHVGFSFFLEPKLSKNHFACKQAFLSVCKSVCHYFYLWPYRFKKRGGMIWRRLILPKYGTFLSVAIS